MQTGIRKSFSIVCAGMWLYERLEEHEIIVGSESNCSYPPQPKTISAEFHSNCYQKAFIFIQRLHYGFINGKTIASTAIDVVI